MTPALVVIGASLGGLQALKVVLSALPRSFRPPVAVVQHRNPDAGDALAVVLQDACALAVCEAEDKMPLEPGKVFLAPSGYHLLVEEDHFALSTEEPVLHAQPSIDVLFETAAATFGKEVVAVVLTGTGQDGAVGAAAVQSAGGQVLVESPDTAQAGAMPRGAMAAADRALALPVERIGGYLAELGR